jgi:conserved hypothetical protein, YceG family
MSENTQSQPQQVPPKQKTRPAKRRRRKNGAVSALIYVIMVLGLSAILAAVGWVMANDVLALNKQFKSAVITVESGDNVADVATLLKEKGIIEYPMVFRLYCAVSKSSDKLAPGIYELNTEMDYLALVRNLSIKSSARIPVTVTIPEGYELARVFELLEEKGVCTVEDLNDMAANWPYKFSFLQEIPLGNATRLEGYLFPDTYEFFSGDDPKMVINKMLLNFDAKFNEDLRELVAGKGITMHEIVIMASMIERETDGNDHEMISSVIYNRLKSDNFPYLQIDATVQYALDERKERLSTADTQIDSPYNTYVVQGLPIGPIANPGMDSLLAAIYPETSSYYYYRVSSDGRTHVFFRTYAEHDSYGR